MELQSARLINSTTEVEYKNVDRQMIGEFIKHRGLTFKGSKMVLDMGLPVCYQWQRNQFTYQWFRLEKRLKIIDKNW